MTPAARDQVEFLLKYMHSKAWTTVRAMEKHLRGQFGYSARGVHHLIRLARYEYGDDVIVCYYSYKRHQNEYRMAANLLDVTDYSQARIALVYRHLVRIVQTLNRGMAEFPNEDHTLALELRTMTENQMAMIEAKVTV